MEATKRLIHDGQIQSDGKIVVRASDTDVVVLLVGLAGRQPNLQLVMDIGVANKRRYLDISTWLDN